MHTQGLLIKESISFQRDYREWTMLLPKLDVAGHHNLSPQHWALFHDVQKWLAHERAALGSNKHMELANPRPTLQGITCDLRKVVTLEEEVRVLFRSYNDLCGTVKCTYDEAGKGNTYTVSLATDKQLAPSSEGSTSSWAGRIFDEPKALILLMVLVCVCAAFTTSSQRWLRLGHVLYALLNPALSHR